MALLCWTFIGSVVLCYAYAGYVIWHKKINQSEFFISQKRRK